MNPKVCSLMSHFCLDPEMTKEVLDVRGIGDEGMTMLVVSLRGICKGSCNKGCLYG
jgi:ABC-type polar amino acid transport system ATPase subunit